MNNKELTELKIEQPDNMEAIEHAFDEVIKDLILLREHVTGFEDARKYDPKHTAGTVPFETTPSNDDIKREAEYRTTYAPILEKSAVHRFIEDLDDRTIYDKEELLGIWAESYLTQKENNE